MAYRVEVIAADGVSRIVEIEADAGATARDVLLALSRKGWSDAAGPEVALELSRPHEPARAVVALQGEDEVTPLLEPGDRLRVVTEEAGASRVETLATVTVVAGPDRGQAFAIGEGEHGIGSGDVALRLADGSVAARHATLLVPAHPHEELEIVDEGSGAGVVMDGAFVTRARLGPRARVALGRSVLAISRADVGETSGERGGVVDVTRTPRVVPPWTPPTIDLPGLSAAAPRTGIPRLAMLAPALLGLGMFAMTGRATSLLLVAMSPLLAAGSLLDSRLARRRWARGERKAFEDALERAGAEVDGAHHEERLHLARLLPSPSRVTDDVRAGRGALWSVRPGDDDFLTVRIGVADVPSSIGLHVPAVDAEAAALAGVDAAARDALAERAATLPSATVAVDLRRSGAVALVGPHGTVAASARGVLLWLAGTHAPSEVSVAALLGSRIGADADWLAWLPHVASASRLLRRGAVATGAESGAGVLAALEEVVVGRTSGAADGPALVVLIDEDCPADRRRLISLAAEGPAVAVHLVWMAADRARVPSPCRTVLAIGGEGAMLIDAEEGTRRASISADLMELAPARLLARSMASLRDDGSRESSEAGLPARVGLTELHGAGGLETAQIATTWQRGGAGPSRVSLAALVGRGVDGPVHLDLAVDGPHALVGGTTGAGKSEFLQAWVLGMALAHPPSRVTFLLVDYKGGSAFGECARLPHCVGLVTDLTPALVDRALVSLRAELRRREEVLAAAGASDLDALRATGRDAPPSLVIVVDEFAALVQEAPEFVDGVVDIAQRGRSLGLHLILATQRPAGVIRERIRANTHLRIALRMADEADSADVLGSPAAARLDRTMPGRVLVRAAPGPPCAFQAGFAGACSAEESTPAVVLRDVGPGSWGDAEPPLAGDGPPDDGGCVTDASRAVEAIRGAAFELGLPPSRRPWREPLSASYDLAELCAAEGKPVIGVVDDPARQRQVAYPVRPGSLLVVGGPGSGRTSALRACAVAALGDAGCPTHAYGIDAAGGALGSLRTLPHVADVVDPAVDFEGVTRVLQLLARPSRERGVRRMLLIDGIGPLWESLTRRGQGERALADLTAALSRAGDMVLDVVVSAARPGEVPPPLKGTLRRTLVLRLADPAGYAMAGAKGPLPAHDSPPGRALALPEGLAVQLAVPGGSATVEDQAAAAQGMARLVGVDARWRAPAVPRIPRLVAAAEVPPAAPGKAVVGIESDSLAPLTVDLRRPIVVAGAPGSGRTTALAWLAHSIRESNPEHRLVLCTAAHSALSALPLWDDVCAGPQAGTLMLERWAAPLAEPGGGIVIVLEGVAGLWPALGDAEAVAAIRAARRAGHTVVGEAETSEWSGGGAAAELRQGRRGLLLRPEGPDALQLFGVTAPRPAEPWPPGRGIWVEAGRASVVHIPTW